MILVPLAMFSDAQFGLNFESGLTCLHSLMSILAASTKSMLGIMRSLAGNEAFTWKGSAVQCVADDLGETDVVMIGGNEVQLSFRLFVDHDEFFTIDTTLVTIDSELWYTDSDKPRPVVGALLVFRGQSLRISRVTVASVQSHYILELSDPDL